MSGSNRSKKNPLDDLLGGGSPIWGVDPNNPANARLGSYEASRSGSGERSRLDSPSTAAAANAAAAGNGKVVGGVSPVVDAWRAKGVDGEASGGARAPAAAGVFENSPKLSFLPPRKDVEASLLGGATPIGGVSPDIGNSPMRGSTPVLRGRSGGGTPLTGEFSLTPHDVPTNMHEKEEDEHHLEWSPEKGSRATKKDGGDDDGAPAGQRKGGGKRARGMVLRWALLKALGPDRWHFATLLDNNRISHYEEAILRAIRGRQGVTVSDVGAGSGLLGMMASRAGGKVTRYERLRPLALLEGKMSRENGVAMRVLTQLPGSTDDSSSGEEEGDGGGGPGGGGGKGGGRKADACDVLVCEVMDPCLVGSTEAGLLGSGLLRTIQECRESGVLGPSTTVIPRAATVRAMAIHLPAQTELVRCPIGTVSGFDLSPFGKFRAEGPEPIYLKDLAHTAITAPFRVFGFSLGGEGCCGPQRVELEVECVAGGVVNAVVFWHELELDDVATLSAGPESAARQGIFMVSRDVLVPEGGGGTLAVTGAYDGGTGITFEVRAAGGGAEDGEEHVGASNKLVQRWHFGMLNDEERNGAYYAAIARALEGGGGKQVLDVGAGTGLLGMMAARSGAGRVVSCEKCEPVAASAQEIVALNGLSGRVSVVRKHSSDLVVGPRRPRIFVSGFGFYEMQGDGDAVGDLQGRADVMVSEIVDCGLLGEGMVPSVRDARKRLLVPGARVIPEGATVYCRLVELPEQPAPLARPLGAVRGFDFSPFNQFCAASYEQIRLSSVEHRALTAEAEVFGFDFTDPLMPQERRRTHRCAATADGKVHAVAFWFRLRLDAEGSIYTGPENASTCWKQAVQFLAAPLAVREGEEVDVLMSHDATRVSFQCRLACANPVAWAPDD